MKKLLSTHYLTLLLCLLGLSSCEFQKAITDYDDYNSSLLEQIQKRGTLRVASRNGPTTFFEGRNGPDGFEYSLAQLFAEEIGVNLEMTNTDSLGYIFKGLETGYFNLAAAGLIITDEPGQRISFSQTYLDITEQLIYHSANTTPYSVQDIIGHSIVVMAGSAHVEHLKQLQVTYPTLSWTELQDIESTELLEKIERGEFEFAILNSNEFVVNQGLYPNTRIAFDLAKPQALAWALPEHDDGSLQVAVNKFFTRIKQDGTLDFLKEQFYGHNGEIAQVNSRAFMKRVKKRLPDFVDIFKKAGAKYDIDWQLLAAIAYQESHLDPRATSPTGVRGMMMLTQMTADEMGIKNRVDVKQSINGGAKYLDMIFDNLPKTITETDRTSLALAAYNVGLGHLNDARKLTEKSGGNPDSWKDVKEYLPLLQKKSYYKKTKHGYARGQEPVNYVQHIRHYYNLLGWSEILEQRHLASLFDRQNPQKTVSYDVAEEPLYKLSLL